MDRYFKLKVYVYQRVNIKLKDMLLVIDNLRRLILMNITRKTGLARGIQGTTSLWLDSKLSVVDVPSRGQSPGGNRAISKASLTHLNHRLLPFMGITRKLRKLSPDF